VPSTDTETSPNRAEDITEASEENEVKPDRVDAEDSRRLPGLLVSARSTPSAGNRP
jgi:hypothetical protein